ncbi:MAG: hypothetical protein ABL931_00235 [Usitatibacteraceae bacterium]
MFKSIRRIGLRIKLEIAFIKNERDAHRNHLADADSRFDIAGFEAEITAIESAIEREVKTEFDTKTSAVAAKERHASSALALAESNQRLMKRDFKSELDPLYDELSRLKDNLSDAYERKSDAHKRLSSAKSSLNSWYAKSDRNFFGNKGKKLPKHAFFGQDLSDRDSYKRQRDSAAYNLSAAQNEINRLKGRKRAITAMVGTIKQDRAQMQELRDSGLNRKLAAEHVAHCRAAVSKANIEAARILHDRSIFEAELMERYMLPTLRQRLMAMSLDRDAFVNSFGLPDEKSKRRQAFEQHFNELNPAL